LIKETRPNRRVNWVWKTSPLRAQSAIPAQLLDAGSPWQRWNPFFDQYPTHQQTLFFPTRDETLPALART